MSYIDKKRKVSVIMGIYNCADTLPDSINSLLNQTYGDWELIMCDDYSNDNTYDIAKNYEEKYNNIRVIKNKQNMGLAASLNHCLKYAKGEYIARHDGDDISLPQRFKIQVDFLDNNKQYALVSSTMLFFDGNQVFGESKLKETPTKKDFVKGSPFSHAPCMMRRKPLNAIGNYTEHKYLRRGQDFFLWYKFYKAGYKGYNLQQSLYMMRDNLQNRKKIKVKDRFYGMLMHYKVLKGLGLPKYTYLYVFKALVSIFIPGYLLNKIHQKSIKKSNGFKINISDYTGL